MRDRWLGPAVREAASVALASLVAVCMAMAGCESCTGGQSGDECVIDGVKLEVGDTGDKDECTSCICGPGHVLECADTCADDAGAPGRNDGGTDDEDAGRPPSLCFDRDLDGFFDCADEFYPERPEAIDCDDTRFYIQPGGYDFPGNGDDDDCDGETDELPACTCSTATGATDLLAAMDLCDDTVGSSTKSGDALQFAVYQDSYFTNVVPEVGPCLVAMSTGDALAATADDLQLQHCTTGFGDGCFQDPDPNAAVTSRVFDLATVTLHLDVPPNARGLAFRFMFMSSEWPEYLCKEYNDTFYAIVESDAVFARTRTNFAFDTNNRPVTVNVGFFEAPRDWTEDLTPTPFGATDSSAECTTEDDPSYVPGCALPAYCESSLPADLRFEGSGSGWLTASTPVEPGEQDVVLTLSIHDEGDGIFDSLALLDHVRWLPYTPPLGVVKE